MNINTKRMLFITEKECVYCAVRAKYLYLIEASIKMFNYNKCHSILLSDDLWLHRYAPTLRKNLPHASSQ